MKRIYTLLTMLLMVCAGAWAQYIGRVITASSQLVSGNTYVVRVSGGSYITDTGSSYSAPNSQNSITDAAIYYFYTDDGGSTWKIKNYSTSKYWGEMTGKGTGSSNTFVPAEESGAGSYQWNFNGTNVTAQCGSYYVNRSSGTMHSHDSGLNLQIYEYLLDKTPSIPFNKVAVVGTKTTSITAATSATDNDHWYLISQTRDSETPLYTNGTQVVRAASSITPTSLSYQMASSVKKYLVRFFATNDGLYYMQFCDGTFIKYPGSDTPADRTILAPTDNEPSGLFAFSLIDGATTFSWNLSSATGKRVDNNGAGSTVVYYGKELQTAAGGNSDWGIYPVTFSSAIPYSFTTTDGAFFYCLTDNQAAGATNYANLWLSRASVGKPQVKLISNEALTTSTGGNNMRSSGGLFTTASSHRYNLSISEGKIISYTIVGTAVGALGITPAGGSVENFAASASVSKKVTLASPAKETYFTLSGSSQWLNVEKFLIEYESDAVAVTSASEIANNGIYTISSYLAERGALYAGETYLNACGGYKNSSTYPANPTKAIDAADDTQQFAIYTSGNNRYIYNLGTGKFVGKAVDNYFKMTTVPSAYWTMSDASGTSSLILNYNGGNSKLCVNAYVKAGGRTYGTNLDTASDGAEKLMFTRIGTLTNEQQTTIANIVTDYEALMANLTELEKYTIGTSLGEYTNVDFPTEAYKEDNIASIRSAVADYDASILASVKLTAAAAISNMTLNIPDRPIFLRIRSTQGSKGYLTAAAAEGRATFTAATDATTIFLWASDAKLVSYSNSFAYADMYVPKDNSDDAVAYNVEAAVSGNIGQYSVTCTYNGNKNYLYSTGSGNADRNTLSESFKQKNSFTLEAVPSLPVTISAARYATLYAPVALEIPAGVKAFSGTVDKTKSQLTMHRIDGVIPANTAVVLKLEDGTEAGTFNFNITTTESGVGENSLLGTTAAQTYNNEFVLGIDTENSENIGFFKLTGSTVLPGFKAYLPSTVLDPGARSITVVWDDETTGIRSIDNGKQSVKNGAIYDLSGRRVENPQRGMYIVNGRKIVVK